MSDPGTGRRLRAGILAAGVALLLSTALLEAVAPGALAVSIVLGTFGLIMILVLVCQPVLFGAVGPGPGVRLIVSATVLGLLSGVLYTLPPHSTVFAVLLLMVAVGFFAVGTGVIGGGLFGVIGGVGGGLLLAAMVMAPTPIALGTMNHTLNCQIPGDRFSYLGPRRDFTVQCPGGRSYRIHTRPGHATGVPVRMLIDPHDLLRPKIADRVHAPKDELAAAVSLLAAVGAVVAAWLNRLRLGDRLRPVVIPRWRASRR